MLPPTTSRVSKHTPAKVNRRILKETEASVALYASAGKETLDRRLGQLDQEWDIERILEANAATLSLFGLIMAAKGGKKWLALPIVVSGFLVQHAVQGWCPPVSVLRRMGFRTSAEIDYERYALKALRGDFKDSPLKDQEDGCLKEGEARQAFMAVLN